MELFKQEMELFLHFHTSNKKKSLGTWYDPKIPKQASETGNGIISPISTRLIKKLFYKHYDHFIQVFQNKLQIFSKQEMELSKL